MSEPTGSPDARLSWSAVARGVVIGISCVLAAFFLAVVVHAVLVHVHPPNENQNAHEWDLLVLSISAGIGGLFAAIALSAWRRWVWWKRLAAVVLGPVFGVAVYLGLAYARYFLMANQ